MSYSVLTYALLSQDVYIPTHKLMATILRTGRWYRQDLEGGRQPSFSDGFFARLYYHASLSNKVDDTFVIAYRGTMPGKISNDWQDLEIFLRTNVGYVDKARMFFLNARDYIKEHYVNNGELTKYQLRLTGHSLGGFLAEVIGAKTGTKTIAFNAPGAAKWALPKRDYKNLILNIDATDGVINKYGASIGTIKKIQVPMGEDSCNGDDLAHERQVAMLGPGAVGALAGEAVADGATCAVRQHLIANLIKGLKQYPAIAHLDF